MKKFFLLLLMVSSLAQGMEKKKNNLSTFAFTQQFECFVEKNQNNPNKIIEFLNAVVDNEKTHVFRRIDAARILAQLYHKDKQIANNYYRQSEELIAAGLSNAIFSCDFEKSEQWVNFLKENEATKDHFFITLQTLPAKYTMSFVKKALLQESIFTLPCIHIFEKSLPSLEVLEENAKKGNYDATVALVKEHVTCQNLKNWLKEHEDMWKNIQITPETLFATALFDEKAINALQEIAAEASNTMEKKLQSPTFLAQKLLATHQLGICLKKAMNGQSDAALEDLADVIVEAYGATEYDYRSDIFEAATKIRALIHQEKVKQVVKNNMPRNKAKKSENPCLYDDYLYMRSLAGNFEILKEDKEKETLFNTLCTQLERTIYGKAAQDYRNNYNAYAYADLKAKQVGLKTASDAVDQLEELLVKNTEW